MTPTSKRLVFFFPGFEPMPAEAHARRFRRAAATTAQTWGVEFTERADPSMDASPEIMRFVGRGSGWSTECEVVIADWSDLIFLYARRKPTQRIVAGLRALVDFAVTGTFFRYLRVSWRYALFFLYPVFLFLGIAALTLLAASLPNLMDISAVHFLWSVPLGLAIGAGLLGLAANRLHLLTLMDDWAFASDLARRSNPTIEAGLLRHRDAMAVRIAASDDDEILVAGHSLGVSLAVTALADALAVGGPKRRLRILSVGSSLLKTALHPAAGDQREAVRRLVVDERIPWVDVQAVSDPLNFYKSSPSGSLGIDGGRAPVVRKVSLRRIAGPQTQIRIRRSFFRRHRQFVYGAERRDGHAFHMILLGPVDFEDYAASGTIDCPPLSRVEEDGGQLGTAS